MITLWIFSLSLLVLVVFLIPGLGAIPYQGNWREYRRNVIKFSFAYTHCGLYCIWRLLLFVFSAGKKPAVFQYMAAADGYCTLLAAVVFIKDTQGAAPAWTGHVAHDFGDDRYAIVRIFYYDAKRHPPHLF